MALDLWTAGIARAQALAEEDLAAAALLSFTASLLRAQRDIYMHLRSATPNGGLFPLSGHLDTDLPRLRPLLPPLLGMVAARGPEALAHGATELQSLHPTALDDMLIDYWRTPSDDQFFAKAFLQPYARTLADARIRPVDRDRSQRDHTEQNQRNIQHDQRHTEQDQPHTQQDQRCPFCGGPPQLAVLQASETQTDGGRHLLCASCLTVWPFRRILCPQCGEEDEHKLGYFHAADSPYRHVRVEVCATCQHYLKAVDLATVGLAVPLVDEIAASALDIWAREQGLTKIERNLVGL